MLDRQPQRRSFPLCLFLAGFLLLGSLSAGCGEDDGPAGVSGDGRPETTITQASRDSQATGVRIELFWTGVDEDGHISGFEWAITESLPDPESLEQELRSSFTFRSDSTFVFPIELDESTRQFHVRAVDDAGQRDPTPASIFLYEGFCTAQVFFRRSEAVGPGGAIYPITSTDLHQPTDTIPVGSTVCFSWFGLDCNISVDELGHPEPADTLEAFVFGLSPVEPPDIPGSAADTARCYGPQRLTAGNYTMYIDTPGDFAGLHEGARRTFVYNYPAVTSFSKHRFAGADDSVEVIRVRANREPPAWIYVADGDTLDVAETGLIVEGQFAAHDPDDPEGDASDVTEYEARVIHDTGFWKSTALLGSYTRDNLFTEPTNDGWKFQVRNIDRFGRAEAPPAQIRFYINRSATFRTQAELRGELFEQAPAEGSVVRVAQGATEIPIHILAVDPDPTRPPNNRMEYRWEFESYIDESQNEQQGPSLPPWADFAERGDHRWGDLATMVSLPGEAAFQPGPHTLLIEAREWLVAAHAHVGTRTITHRIHFTVEHE